MTHLDVDKMLPPAAEAKKTVMLFEVEKADEEANRRNRVAEANQELMKQLTMPSGLSEEEGIKRGASIIARAAANGLREVQIHRFPNQLCTDRGRAINMLEESWPETLTGRAKEIYELWHKHFRPRGYKLRAEIVDFSSGVPGDVGLYLSWS